MGWRTAWALLALPALLAAAGAPAPVTGQDPLGTPLRERGDGPLVLVRAARAELGVVLGETERVGGRTGVRVLEARPERPAARAGIRAGDVLLSLDGTPLAEDAGGHLVRLMRNVEPGDTVVIVLHRDGGDRTVRVVTERGPLVHIRDGIRIAPEVRLRPGADPTPALEDVLSRLRELPGRLGRHRMELVNMNPGLGRYFGVDQGVLVASIDGDSALGLQPGDVILSVAGRDVRDAAHARSILASYRRDEVVEMEVIRDRRRITVRSTASSS
jgi:S1-C subfamily serine protease